jgi:cell division protein FtsL
MSYGFLGFWSFPLAVIPLFGLVYWANLFKTETTVWFAYGHLFLLILAAFISLAETNSIHFLDQRLFAQVAIVELIASLWLLKGYYRWLKLESDFSYGLASALRVTFFCIVPLLFIHFSRKIDFSFFGPAIWVSVLIAYFLFKKLKHLALQIEVIVLVGFAMLFVLTFLDLIGMFFGVGVLIGLAIIERSYKEAQFLSSQIKSFLVVIPYLLMILLWFMSFKILGQDFSVSCVISSLFLIILVLFKKHLAIINHSYILATRLSIILLFITFFSFVISQSNTTPVLVMVYLLLLGILLYNKQQWYDLEKKINRWNFAFALHQLLIIVGVAIFIDWIGVGVQGPISSVLLVGHAIILVFIALKQRSKFINQISMVLFIISLLKVLTNDISDFSMPQKVIVFLILGLLLLAASYGYVKLKKKFEVNEELLEVETKIIDPKIEIEE